MFSARTGFFLRKKQSLYDPYWENVSLLLHADGTNGSTTFVDSSNVPKTVYANSGATISTAQSKFGGASGLFVGALGTPNIPYVNNDASLNLHDTNYWTVELFLNLNDTRSFFINKDGLGNVSLPQWRLGISNTTAVVIISPTGISGAQYISSTSWPSTIGVWTHFAAVRNGPTITIYKDGISVGSATVTATMGTRNATLTIGTEPDHIDYGFNAYMDELRITKGVARYTANFTPPYPSVSGLPDPYLGNVVLLLHGEGVNGSTTFVDSSPTQQTGTSTGAVVSTTKFKFGTSSAYFNGSSYLSFASSPDFQFGAGDFSIECFVLPDAASLTGAKFICAQQDAAGLWSTSTVSFELVLSDGVPKFRFHYGASVVDVSGSGVLSSSTFTHIYAGRSGSTLYLGQNGVIYSTSVAGLTMNSVSLPLVLGRVGSVPTSIYYYAGYIDEFRITKGVARYTANFTPPTQAFPN